ncbi:N-acetylglucosamine kinase-like BadF-type ATPase [Bacillus oleivorans]|uniref:N-acetylglucosamine kinase-like BadF-type ATPase n=2 Tax=Bacillus oleivorans TaxID=1448271 RepID=A0A285D2R3_9BACI|nr:N-acetylglucosamine kinase-like BadF-type ATPase [Bacillus oleivorans]
MATCYDLDSAKALFTAETGRVNFLIQFEESVEQVSRAIEACVNYMENVQPEKILIGAAGAISKEICKRAEREIQVRWYQQVRVIDDARLAHTALLQGQDGILVIAGTGSIALGRCNGMEWRTGGWGYLLGDEGSGYWVSIKAIQYALHQLEMSQNNDGLTNALLQRINGQSISDIKNFVYSSARQEIAGLSKLISEEANRNSEAALSILRRAGVELALLVKRSLSAAPDPKQKLKIAVSGSLLMKNDVVFESFKQVIERDLPMNEIIRENQDVCSAVLYTEINVQ